MEEFFLALGDLPLHPLVVHFAVVLFPLALVGLLLVTFVPSWRQKHLLKALIATAATVPFIFLAQQSGEALSEVMYEPEPHSEFGEILLPLALGLLFFGFTLWFSLKKAWPVWLSNVLGFVLVTHVVAAIVMTILVGHSGAAATWTGVVP